MKSLFTNNYNRNNDTIIANLAHPTNLAHPENLANPFATPALPLHNNFEIMNALERTGLEIIVCIVDFEFKFFVLPRKGCCGDSHLHTLVGII